MMKPMLAIAALAGALAVPAVAEAAPAQMTANVNLRTGPGTQYYAILVLPAGAPVEVYGCLQGYSWCDVGYGRERGWVASRYLSMFYAGPVFRPRPVRPVPYVTFNFGWWDKYYAGRPWYGQRPFPGGPRPGGPGWGGPGHGPGPHPGGPGWGGPGPGPHPGGPGWGGPGPGPRPGGPGWGGPGPGHNGGPGPGPNPGGPGWGGPGPGHNGGPGPGPRPGGPGWGGPGPGGPGYCPPGAACPR